MGGEAAARLCMPTRQKVVPSSSPNSAVKVKRTALYCGYLHSMSYQVNFCALVSRRGQE